MEDRNLLIEKILGNFHAIKHSLSSEGHFTDKGSGITITQATVLFMLKKNGEMSYTEMAKILGISKSATTQLIDSLTRHDFISRQVDATDKRVYRLTLSSKGLKFLKSLRQKAFDQTFTIFGALSIEELKQLDKITSKLAINKENKIA